MAYSLFLGGSFLGSMVAVWSRNELYHGLFGIAWLISLLAWVGMGHASIPGSG